MRRTPSNKASGSILVAVAVLSIGRVNAQPDTAVSAQERAPADFTGHWVSLITDDWVYRMITPARGDYSYIPLNAEGRRIADTWDPAQDAAIGEECRGYAAPAIMRLPVRVEVSWEDDQTLKLDIDTGMQTRLLHFDPDAPRGPRSWQGHSAATWDVSGDNSRRSGFYRLTGSLDDVGQFGSLRVDTDNLRPGYLRRNGVPFSADARLTEFFNLLTEDNGDQYLVIQTFIDDPTYLTQHFVRTLQFKREANGSNRAPLSCSDSEALFISAEGLPRPDGEGPQPAASR